MDILAEIEAWLLRSVSGQDHVVPPGWVYWHARFMVAGWTILLPAGMLIARFFKITPRQNWPAVLDNTFWWRSHIRLQSAGLLFVFCGLILILAHRQSGSLPAGGFPARLHVCGGWLVVVAGFLQMASGLLRGTKGGPTAVRMQGDHYDMTPRRILFEYVHKILGWGNLALSIGVTAAGLALVDAPRWMVMAIILWWLAFALLFVWLQARGRCIDTYQAIWGDDPAHPGNSRQPIGWGIRRPGIQAEMTEQFSPPDG